MEKASEDSHTKKQNMKQYGQNNDDKEHFELIHPCHNEEWQWYEGCNYTLE